MKPRIFARPALFFGLIFAAWTLLTPGCKTAPRIDWDSRVGNYTYDQAVVDLGPPDRSTTLSDGKVVADWITQSSGGVSFGVGTGYWGGHTGVGVGQSIGTGYGERVLRLTFGPDHKLVSWVKNY